MKTIYFFFIAGLLLLGNTRAMQAQSQSSANQEQEIIPYAINRLAELTKEINDLYPKAISGKLSDRKQIVELVAEAQATRGLFRIFNPFLSAEEHEQLKEIIDRFPSQIKENQETLFKGLDTVIPDENIGRLDAEMDQLVNILPKAIAKEPNAKQSLMITAFKVAKGITLLDFFEINRDQELKVENLLSKLNSASLNGKPVDLGNLFFWFVNNQADPTDMNNPEQATEAGIDASGFTSESLIKLYKQAVDEYKKLYKEVHTGNAEALKELEFTQDAMNGILLTFEDYSLTEEEQKQVLEISEDLEDFLDEYQ